MWFRKKKTEAIELKAVFDPKSLEEFYPDEAKWLWQSQVRPTQVPLGAGPLTWQQLQNAIGSGSPAMPAATGIPTGNPFGMAPGGVIPLRHVPLHPPPPPELVKPTLKPLRWEYEGLDLDAERVELNSSGEELTVVLDWDNLHYLVESGSLWRDRMVGEGYECEGKLYLTFQVGAVGLKLDRLDNDD